MIIGFTDLGQISTNLDSIKKDFERPKLAEIIKDTKPSLNENEAIVAKVIDGDTITVISHDGKEERVRLLHIDTPESVHPNKPPQKYGKEASDFAKKYLKSGKKVTLVTGKPVRDKYDRILAYVFVDGININKLMVEKGYARVAFVDDPNDLYVKELKTAEKQAKKKKMNIWSIDGYVTDKGYDMSVVQ